MLHINRHLMHVDLIWVMANVRIKMLLYARARHVEHIVCMYCILAEQVFRCSSRRTTLYEQPGNSAVIVGLITTVWQVLNIST